MAEPQGSSDPNPKLTSQIEPDDCIPPLAFWAGLSRTELSLEALIALGRTFPASRPHSPPLPRKAIGDLNSKPRSGLLRFARQGGPDLKDLRGYPAFPRALQHKRLRRQRERRYSPSVTSVPSSQPTYSRPSTFWAAMMKPTAYDRNFAIHLADHGVFDEASSAFPDVSEAKAAFSRRRPSLDGFSNEDFRAFMLTSPHAKDEKDILADVIPVVLGQTAASHDRPTRDTLFAKMEPLTDGTIAQPKPDMYFGSSPRMLSCTVREKLSNFIIPSSASDKDVAPNLFIEVKGRLGTGFVALQQVQYEGAIGSRAMNYLQNYGNTPVFDDKPYSFSAVCVETYLRIYAHHITRASNGSYEYHMTRIGSYALDGDRVRSLQVPLRCGTYGTWRDNTARASYKPRKKPKGCLQLNLRWAARSRGIPGWVHSS